MGARSSSAARPASPTWDWCRPIPSCEASRRRPQTQSLASCALGVSDRRSGCRDGVKTAGLEATARASTRGRPTPTCVGGRATCGDGVCGVRAPGCAIPGRQGPPRAARRLLDPETAPRSEQTSRSTSARRRVVPEDRHLQERSARRLRLLREPKKRAGAGGGPMPGSRRHFQALGKRP